MSIAQNDICSTSRYVKILIDSGANASIIHHLSVRTNIYYNPRKSSANKWFTIAGCVAEVEIKLPELNITAHFFALFYIASQESNQKRMEMFVSFLILENFIKKITRKPFPISKIQDLLLQLESFKYASS